MTVKEKSIGIEKRKFEIKYTEEEITQLKENFSDISLSISKLEVELDRIKREFKGKMAPLKNQAEMLLIKIQLGFYTVEKDVYLIPDYDNDIIKIMTEEGELLDERKMTPEERQLTLNIN